MRDIEIITVTLASIRAQLGITQHARVQSITVPPVLAAIVYAAIPDSIE
jgi:hypothetical protein